MDRRTFLLSVSLIPLSTHLFANSQSFSAKELTGHVSPDLFGKNHRLRKKSADAYLKMQKAAEKKGIKLFSVSSYRGFAAQQRIWNNKYEKYIANSLSPEKAIAKIIEYSAYPGASRHHWGTDLDISDLAFLQPADPLNPKHFKKGGVYEKLYAWMGDNASKFGFYEVYTEANDRTGFNFEPWHYSFAELSKPMLQDFIALDFEQHLASKLIKGHEFIDQAFWNKYKKEFVLGINPLLIP